MLAQIRLQEAQTLLKAGLPDGAYYLAGYSVECALKARIAKRTQRHEFPDKKSVDASYTHNLKDLIKAANLENDRAVYAAQDPVFQGNWDLVQQWSERSRYERNVQALAAALIEAIANKRHGVMTWIKQRW